MDDYNFWRDLFDTYQSLPPWMQFAWFCGIVLTYFGTAALTAYTVLGLTRRRRRRQRRRQQEEPEKGNPHFTTTAALPDGFEPSGLFRVRTDDHGGLYLEQVGPTPMLDWDGPDKN
ncbi:MAG: hypothetical protein HRU27_17835 [Rhizobiaceae bacterium]|nr:hypothetical protein [Hyphomicrobiales bacterium]NRB32454.1 hypothetical protein [Rhizobiaceae bacterium]